jgi:hypothetical protein
MTNQVEHLRYLEIRFLEVRLLPERYGPAVPSPSYYVAGLLPGDARVIGSLSATSAIVISPAASRTGYATEQMCE